MTAEQITSRKNPLSLLRLAKKRALRDPGERVRKKGNLSRRSSAKRKSTVKNALKESFPGRMLLRNP